MIKNVKVTPMKKSIAEIETMVRSLIQKQQRHLKDGLEIELTGHEMLDMGWTIGSDSPNCVYRLTVYPEQRVKKINCDIFSEVEDGFVDSCFKFDYEITLEDLCEHQFISFPALDDHYEHAQWLGQLHQMRDFYEIHYQTGFANGDLFNSEQEVKDYFTEENLMDIMGDQVDLIPQQILDKWADRVIENRWHMKGLPLDAHSRLDEFTETR